MISKLAKGLECLKDLEQEIRRRLASGSAWDEKLFTFIIEDKCFQYVLRSQLRRRVQRFVWLDSSLCEEQWFDVVRSYVWEELGRMKLVNVDKFLKSAEYLCTTIHNCFNHAVCDMRRGSGSRSGKVRIKPAGKPIPRATLSDESFELLRQKDLEDCIIERVLSTFPSRAKEVMKLLIIDRMKAVDIARSIGQDPSNITRIRQKYLPLLQKKVEEHCLGLLA